MAQSSLPPEIRGLPIPERVQMAEQIWDSIVEDEQAFRLTAAQQEELGRRIEAHQVSPNRGKPWEEVKQRFRGE